jgi:hypothetical protein
LLQKGGITDWHAVGTIKKKFFFLVSVPGLIVLIFKKCYIAWSNVNGYNELDCHYLPTYPIAIATSSLRLRG